MNWFARRGRALRRWQRTKLSFFRLEERVVPAAFTPGDLVIYRVGDGTSALNSNATAVFVDEYTPSGTLVQSIPLPTSVSGLSRRLTASGTATSEGLITRSVDGRYILLPGYDAALGTASITSSASSSINRVAGRIDAAGNIDTTTALTDFSTGSNPRGVSSTNGTDLWVTGGAGGVRYSTLGSSTSTQLSTTVTNLRGVGVIGGQLYISSASGSFRLATVGLGAPTTAGQTITNLPGFPTSTTSPYSFLFADLNPTLPGVDTVYVTDDTSLGNILKYTLSGGTWSATGSISASLIRGLTGVVSGSSVTLYGTTSGNLYSFTDTTGYGGTASGTVNTIATAPTNEAFRGIAFVPQISNTSIDGPGNLVINVGSGRTDDITVKLVGTNYQISDSSGLNKFTTVIPGSSGNGTNTITVPIGAVTGTQI
jgi:hypothetical protein